MHAYAQHGVALQQAAMQQAAAEQLAAQQQAAAMAPCVAKADKCVSYIQAAAGDAKAAGKGVQALGTLMVDSKGKVDAQRQAAVAQAGGAAVLQAMAQHATNAPLQAVAMDTLSHFINGSADISAAVCAAGGVTLLLAAMANHSHAFVQRRAVTLAARLARSGGSAVCAGLAQAGALQAVTAALQAHGGEDARTVLVACIFFETLLCDPVVAMPVAREVWSANVVPLVQSALPIHAAADRSGKMQAAVERLATIMAQAKQAFAAAGPHGAV